MFSRYVLMILVYVLEICVEMYVSEIRVEDWIYVFEIYIARYVLDVCVDDIRICSGDMCWTYMCWMYVFRYVWQYMITTILKYVFKVCVENFPMNYFKNKNTTPPGWLEKTTQLFEFWQVVSLSCFAVVSSHFYASVLHSWIVVFASRRSLPLPLPMLSLPYSLAWFFVVVVVVKN